MVARRLEGIGDDERALLDAAAVDGLEFDGDALAAVVERPLLGVLRSLQHLYRKRGLVVPRATGYRFAHALFQDVIYEDLAPALRREIHSRLARHLESREVPVDPERLGLHWERAGILEQAAPHLRRAASDAAKRQDYMRAIDLAKRSGLLSGDIGAGEAAAHADLLFALTGCLSDLGRADEAKSIIERLLSAAADLEDESLRLRTTVWREDINYYSSDSVEAVDEGQLQHAVKALPESADLWRGLYLLGLIAQTRGDLKPAGKWLRQADALARSLGMRSIQAQTLNALGVVERRLGRMREAEECYAEAARIALADGRRTDAVVPEVNRAIVAYQRGAFDGLEQALERSVRTLSLIGASDRAAHANVFLAQVRYAQGDRLGAERAIEEAMETLERSKYVLALLDARIERGRLELARGDLAAATETLRAARSEVRDAGRHDIELKVALLDTHRWCLLGNFDRAAKAAGEAVSVATEHPETDNVKALLLWLTEACAYGLDPQALEGINDTFHEAKRLPSLFGDLIAGARAVHEEGGSEHLMRTADALRRPEIGERHTELRTLGAWFETEALRRANETSEATQCATSALAEAERLGHVWLQLCLLQQLDSLHEDPERRTRAMALLQDVAAGLEPSEREPFVAAWSSRVQ